jgi:hypothetical protein
VGKAAKTSDPDVFYDHYDKALELTDAKKTVTTRKALGLAMTPPKGDEGDGSEGGGTGDGSGSSGAVV